MNKEINIKYIITEKVQEMANERNGNSQLIVNEYTPLFESKILNSYRLLELVEYFELTFNIELSEEDLSAENFENIERLTSVFVKKIAMT